MIRIIKILVKMNRSASGYLKKKIPLIFGEKSYNRAFVDELNRIVQELKSKNDVKILEVGGIDRPVLQKDKWCQYDGLDIEDKKECYDVYDHYYVQSIEQRLPQDKQYDLVVSKTLLEHVPNNEETFRTIYACLKNNGYSLHYLPCKNHPYSLCTRAVSHKWQKILIKYLRPQSVSVSGYKVYYNLCAPGELKRCLKAIGFKDISIKCFWNENDYFAFCLPAFIIVSLMNKIFQMLNLKYVASGMVVSFRK